MRDSVKLSELDAAIDDIDYPTDRDDVLDSYGELRLQLADGEVTVEEVLSDSSVTHFESASELASEVFAFLPREAVGEPYQSEGDG
ncbi:DUF5789 family protein [Halorubellus salinus]|uniref:DUF5789 family protein n=1 Tax=Halorubellus salinus TaxID=755309 RepID=UPI001D064E22|nr:hypothetical protein [Halorubellus salinus]